MQSVYSKANKEGQAFRDFRSSGATAFKFPAVPNISNDLVSEKGRHTWNCNPEGRDAYRYENRSPMSIIQNDPAHLLGED
jgi:hypothetical protein